MKLALLYHQFITRGGLEGYLREFAGQLKLAGHELVLVTSRIDPGMRQFADEVRLIPPAFTSRGTLARFAKRSAALVPELKVDAVLGFGRTWRQDLHRAGGGCHWHYSQLLPWWKRLNRKNQLELALERQLYTGGETSHFIVNSSKVQRELAEAYQVPLGRVSVIRTAVDTQKWQPAITPEIRLVTRQQLGIAEGVPALLFASLDHRRKGLGTLLPALAQIPKARLWVAGQSLDAWQPLLRQLGLTDRVTSLGRADLRPWYQAVDWFVHPTQYDACANTVLQSMASGLPGLISTADGAAELIREQENGMVLHHPTNAEALATSLLWALNLSESQRQQLGEAARKTVQPFTWTAHGAAWQAALAALGSAHPL